MMRLEHLLAAAVLAASPALAQTSATQPAPAAQAEASATATDAELQGFAQATLALHALGTQDAAAMAAAIEKAGLTVARYNEIAAQMQKDPAFAGRVTKALQAAQMAKAGAPAAGQAAGQAGG